MYQENNGFAVALERNNELNLLPNPKTLADLRIQVMPEGGVDKLNFIAWDTIDVTGYGKETVELRGYYVIDRANPTDSDWEKASVDIRMAEMNIEGESKLFGKVHASVNYERGIESRGQVRAGTVYPGVADSPKLCEMEGYMKFEMPDIGLTAFNKDKILLQHKITHIPPVGQGGGTGEVAINLYNVEDPDGAPIAILRQVKTHIGSWIR
ncbi:MAG TPA: DUF6073 family protein [Pyrinomonadaceae bacterium]|nr:DUF6073 family protein [Pyrinomonadaceae bacterium]